MCFLSSLHGISDGLTDDSKFYLALLGQVRTEAADVQIKSRILLIIE